MKGSSNDPSPPAFCAGEKPWFLTELAAARTKLWESVARHGERIEDGLKWRGCHRRELVVNSRKGIASGDSIRLILRPCDGQMPSSVYGHNSQPKAEECSRSHHRKSRVMQDISDHYYDASR